MGSLVPLVPNNEEEDQVEYRFDALDAIDDRPDRMDALSSPPNDRTEPESLKYDPLSLAARLALRPCVSGLI